MKSDHTAKLGAFFVGLAAILWATDAIFRYPLMARGLDSISIVLIDHLLCLCVLFPYVFFRARKDLTQLRAAEWFGLIFIGAGASGLATVLFTSSFGMVNPSVAILIQKLQPIFVILLAFIFLRERPGRSFMIWGPIALISGFVLSFPNFDFHFTREISLESKGSIYALTAAVIWAIGTVVGKALLSTVKSSVVTFWRFGFGGLFLLMLFLLSGPSFSKLMLFTQPGNLKAILYISMISGLFAMVIYYNGMKRTSATVTTLMELLFPVSAVFINAIFLQMPLKPMQIVASLVLVFAVTQLNSEA